MTVSLGLLLEIVMNLDLLYFTARIVQPANRKRAAFLNEFTSSLRVIQRFWHRFPNIYIQSRRIFALDSWTGIDEFR